MRNDIIIRPETHKDFKDIVSLDLESFRRGTTYSDGTDIVALNEEIRDSEYYIPELSFVAELDGKIVGQFMFSKFPLSRTKDGDYYPMDETKLVLLAPVAVHPDHFKQGVGTAMLTQGIEAVRNAGYRGIFVEGDFNYYGRFGFGTSADFGLYATSGFPLTEPRCMMFQECHPGSFTGYTGYICYNMYYNA